MQLIQELLEIHILSVIQSSLQQHRELSLLRIAFIILYELTSIQSQENPTCEMVLQDVMTGILQESILPLSLLAIQFIPVESETLISALNFLNIASRNMDCRKQLISTDCIPVLARFLSMKGVPSDVQVLSVALLSRLAALGKFTVYLRSILKEFYSILLLLNYWSWIHWIIHVSLLEIVPLLF